MLVTACADGLRFQVQESLEAWYGPRAASLRLQHQGHGVPFGSGEDLGIFWNVAVSNVIQRSRYGLQIMTQGGEVQVPLELGGSRLPSKRLSEVLTF